MLRFLFLVLLAGLATGAVAQSPVRGSGEIVTQVRPVSTFSALEVDFPATIEVSVGASPFLEITADGNIQTHIGSRQSGRWLRITQDRWIQPSERVQIRIGTPLLMAATIGGYGDLEITGISGPRFEMDASVGDVKLYGTAERIRIRATTGTVDASELSARHAEVNLDSWGTVRVQASASLVADLSGQGTVIYHGEPEKMEHLGEGKLISADEVIAPVPVEVQYVAFTIKNDRRRSTDFFVEGPPDSRFSYGFPMRPGATRKENWPVGTRLFRENGLGMRTHVYTVAIEDSGKTVPLFSGR